MYSAWIAKEPLSEQDKLGNSYDFNNTEPKTAGVSPAGA